MISPVRLVLAAAFAGAFAAPAAASDCTDPKQTCGYCGINWEMSTQDPRPVVCRI